MLKKEISGSAILFFVFGAAFYMTFAMNEKCSTYPQMVTAVGLMLVSINLGRAVYRHKRNIPMGLPPSMSAGQTVSAVLALAAAFLYIILVRTVGYVTITFLFTTLFSFYLSTQTKDFSKPWVYPAVGLVTTLLLYAVFGMFLNVPLPVGILI